MDFVTLWDYIWVHWSGLGFCGMSISRFWLNLVNEAGWFDFWKLMGLGIFGLYGPIDSERGIKPFLYALGKRNFSLTKSPIFFLVPRWSNLAHMG